MQSTSDGRKNDFVRFPAQKATIKVNFTHEKSKLQMITVGVKEELDGGVKDSECDPSKALFHNNHYTQYQLTHMGMLIHMWNKESENNK